MDLHPGQYAALSVSDNGHGIPSDLMDKVFEPYFTTKEKGKGTGLGPAVAYGIIREHKGSIKIDGEIGKGTTFTVYLPLMKESDTDESHDGWITVDDTEGRHRQRIFRIDPRQGGATPGRGRLCEKVVPAGE